MTVTRIAGRTGDLAYTDSGGDGQVLVYLHSLGMDSTMWERQVAHHRSTRRVVTIDLPGHGRSGANPPPYSLDDLGQDVLYVIRSLGVATFDVVGISLGGLLALWLAIEAPHSVKNLVASNTAARLGSEEFWSARIAAVEEGGMDAIKETVVARFFAPDITDRDPAVLDSALGVFSATDPQGYIGCCTVLRVADLTQAVGAIECRTLVVGAELDVATPPEVTGVLHQQIAPSQLETIAGAGHLPNLDRPGDFDRVVNDFLATDVP